MSAITACFASAAYSALRFSIFSLMTLILCDCDMVLPRPALFKMLFLKSSWVPFGYSWMTLLSLTTGGVPSPRSDIIDKD